MTAKSLELLGGEQRSQLLGTFIVDFPSQDALMMTFKMLDASVYPEPSRETFDKIYNIAKNGGCLDTKNISKSYRGDVQM